MLTPSSSGNALAGGRNPAHCTNSTWVEYYEACLDCALDFDIWKLYGNGVSGAASSCGLSATPSPSGDAVAPASSTVAAPSSSTVVASPLSSAAAPSGSDRASSSSAAATEAPESVNSAEPTTTAPPITGNGTVSPSPTSVCRSIPGICWNENSPDLALVNCHSRCAQVRTHTSWPADHCRGTGCRLCWAFRSLNLGPRGRETGAVLGSQPSPFQGEVTQAPWVTSGLLRWVAGTHLPKESLSGESCKLDSNCIIIPLHQFWTVCFHKSNLTKTWSTLSPLSLCTVFNHPLLRQVVCNSSCRHRVRHQRYPAPLHVTRSAECMDSRPLTVSQFQVSIDKTSFSRQHHG